MPRAYYNEILDAIYVIAVDCSFTEHRISDLIDLKERNYLGEGQKRYIGFNVNGARAFCKAKGLPSKGAVSIERILLTLNLCETNPRARGAIKEVAIPILEDNNLDMIEFPTD